MSVEQLHQTTETQFVSLLQIPCQFKVIFDSFMYKDIMFYIINRVLKELSGSKDQRRHTKVRRKTRVQCINQTCLHGGHIALNQPFQSVVEIRYPLGLEKFFVINQDREAIVLIYGYIRNQKDHA